MGDTETLGSRLLTQAIEKVLLDEHPPIRLRLLHCDSADGQRFIRFEGLALARWALFEEHERAKSATPTLVLGLLTLTPHTAKYLPWLAALIAWPGFAYLPYGFTKDELVAAARNVVDGAKTPFPPGLLPKPEDVLQVTLHVRHWLTNRYENVERCLEDFEGAMHGKFPLNRLHFDPVPAISEPHQRMLDRLWDLEPAALRFAPAMSGLGPVKAAITEFKVCWLALEIHRDTLKCSDASNQPELLLNMVTALRAVFPSIQNAIAACHMLDDQIKTEAA